MPEFEPIMLANWPKLGRSHDLNSLACKLKKLKQIIKENFVPFTNDMSGRVSKARHDLIRIQNEVVNQPQNHLLRIQERECCAEYLKLLKYERMFISQKAKVKWAKEGDVNSAFFHACLKRNRINSRILQLNTSSGTTDSPDVIKQELINFF
uniref:Uncharacterized protein n=1 Tax=Kalanchoe fedtschenkoi TaxID=63787 RepID=A0A7N0UHU1_KALFE